MSAPIPPSGPFDLGGLRVVVAGLGRSGRAAVRFLARRGARVTASEREPRAAIAGADELEALGATLETGGHAAATFAAADLVITSPGVPLTLPALAAARQAGVPVWAEVELAFRFLQGPLIGITGSNGKSTTTAWTAHILAEAGVEAVACGNLGTPLLDLAGEDRPERRLVTELSSFQLEGIETLRPRVAVMTNISPDHQDRYASLDDYVAAKARLFENQGPDDHAVLNAGDPAVADMARRPGGPARVLFSGVGPVDEGAYASQGVLRLRLGGEETGLVDASSLPLPGRHNVENALAAALAAHLAGAPAAALARGLASFPGLPHRMEKVAEAGGVVWFNDSKATNVGATRAVVESLDRPLVLILGGLDKGGDFASLAGLLPGRVRRLILMGAARSTIAAALGDVVPSEQVATLDEAVEAAAAAARDGDAVVLAPACASFDAYGNFEERGDHFRALARRITGGTDVG